MDLRVLSPTKILRHLYWNYLHYSIVLLWKVKVFIMWDHEIRAMVSTHALIAASMFMATVLPAVFVLSFSVYGTHLLWLYCTSGAVNAVSVVVFWLLGVTPSTKKNTLGYKVRMSSLGNVFILSKPKEMCLICLRFLPNSHTYMREVSEIIITQFKIIEN